MPGEGIKEAASSLKKLLMLGEDKGFIVMGDEELHVYIHQSDPGWITMKSWNGYKVEWHFDVGPLVILTEKET